jgi:hypothetical protein
VDFKGNHNLTVVAVSVAMGVLPVGVPTIYAKFPDWFQTVMNSGISAGCLTAIVLNLLFNHLAGKGGSVGGDSAETVGLPGGGGQETVEKSREEVVQVVPAQAVHLGGAPVDLADHSALAQHPEVVGGRRLGHGQVEVRTGELVADRGELSRDLQTHRVREGVQDALQPDLAALGVREGTTADGGGGHGGSTSPGFPGSSDSGAGPRESHCTRPFVV